MTLPDAPMEAARNMTNHRTYREKITVRFVRRDDGGLQAHCDDVPGFYLSGSDRSAVYRDVLPALRALIRHNLDIQVEVYPLKPGIYQVQERRSDESIPDEQEYVIDRLAA